MLWLPRPHENGLHMQRELATLGVASVCLPLIDIEYVSPPDRGLLKSCSQLFFFSRYAVRALVDAGVHSRCDDFSSHKVFAIGPGTADELTAAHIHVDGIVPAPHTSEAFIAHFDDFSREFSLSGSTGLLVGEGGRKVIVNEFRRRSVPVIEIEVYRRIMPPLDQKSVLKFVHRHGVTAIVITSLSMLTHLLSLGSELTSALRQTTFLVSSERVAQACRRAGFFNVIISQRAANDAMIACILSYFKEQT